MDVVHVVLALCVADRSCVFTGVGTRPPRVIAMPGSTQLGQGRLVHWMVQQPRTWRRGLILVHDHYNIYRELREL